MNEAEVTVASKPPVSMLVISDIHAVSREMDSAESYARTWTKDHPTHNALTAAKEFVRNEGITADVLLCPGDLANLVDEDGMEYAWKDLQEIKDLLGAHRVIATAGNHDVIRPEEGVDPKSYEPNAALKKLVAPPFPDGTQDGHDDFFNEDFVVVTGSGWRVVSLNSCAEHGHEKHHKHGSVRDGTLRELKEAISDDEFDINVLLCHHHPVQWTRLAHDDTSHMRGGDRLLELLDIEDPARWIVVHGHKHYPALGYAGDSTSGPVRFSAGSLSVQLYPALREEEIRNQMYLLSFDIDQLNDLSLAGGGTFKSWDWSRKHGMRPARRRSGLPARGGFGFRRDGRELAAMALQLVRDTRPKQRLVTGEELVRSNARWEYVAPVDLIGLGREVKKLGGLLVYEDDGTIKEISFASI